jgi:hypothetical protein
MRKHITWALALGLMLTGATAFAQTPQATQKPNPAQRLHIAKRMRDGVRSGQLTRQEVMRLRQRFDQIRQHAKQMRASGALAPKDRLQLRQEWRRAGRALFLMKHNRIKR